MINKVTLIGNLGGDPEIRHLDNGTAVGRFSLATNENYRDKDGNWQKLTEWHNIVVWRELAERAEKMLKKGMQVYVEGKISYRKYTDKDGVSAPLLILLPALSVCSKSRKAAQRTGSLPQSRAMPAAHPALPNQHQSQ